MSSKPAGKRHESATTHIGPEEPIIYSNIVISFSEFRNEKKPTDIYNEEEKIPFRKRHLAFQIIFRNEFSIS
ncbi:MAG: hypothetical protein JSV62_09885 [Promethearchaeota archaeon]|nr:MAG: hypothetical protein JSV62_09885 [Candidatus Lokiarchaeota archaeon]